MFFDTHSHIHFAQHFPDVEELIERALDAEVTHQMIVGCTPKDSFQALEFVKQQAAKGRPNFWSTLGVHPHSANEWTPAIERRFEELAKQERSGLQNKSPKIVALGELGLDYFRNLQPPELQKKAFEGQLQLALKLDLPVIIHVREAWDDALAILQNIGNTKVILHCFTGSMEQATICWERGYYLSFSGVLTYPKNQYLREVAAQAPLDRILLETDCPYLPPQSYRGKRNEPAYIVETAKELARIRNMAFEDIGAVTTKNAQSIFQLV